MSILRIFTILFLTALTLPLGAQEGGAYRLKAGDQIRLSVFQEPDLATEVALTVSGEVSLPLIGNVQLMDMTLKEAEEAVTKLYDADYLVEPRLSINLLAAAAERVSVIGAVTNPGEVSIPVNSVLDLVSALDWAGGLAANADPSRVELKRGESTTSYDLRKLRLKGAQQIPLQDGDRVNVPASAFANKSVTIMGEVQRAGPVEFPINGRLDLDIAVGLAGGFTELADQTRITVKRNGNVYAVSLQEGERALAPGDIVTVPASRFVGKSVTVTGLVGKPGPVAFPLNGRLDVVSAIAHAGDFARLANKKKVSVTRHGSDGNKQTWQFDLTDMAAGKINLFYLLPGDTVWVPERRF